MVKIATWNVNGIRARQQQVLEWIEQDRPDILCLQELKAAREQIPATLSEMEGYCCYWHGERAYSGVGLLVQKGMLQNEPQFGHPDFDFETRIVTAQIGNLIIGSVYVPNGGKDYEAKLHFLDALKHFATECGNRNVDLILCGDMNVTRTDQDVHPKERKPNAIGQRPDERELYELILSEGGLADIGRALDPDNDGLFTWWPPWRQMRQKNIGWRLDYILASASLAGRIPECKVLSNLGTSDHAPVVAELKIEY